MQFFTTLFTLFTITSLATAGFVKRDYYAANYADLQLQRIDNYKKSHQDLTAEQTKVLGDCVDLVKNVDYSKISDIRAAVEDAFGVSEAAYILNGKQQASENSAQTKRSLLRRARDCNCSTDDNYCSDSQYCQYNSGNCNFNAGCGTLWLEECDGRCVKK